MFLNEYSKWLASDALTKDEKGELELIKDDEREIESRFSSLISFGTAGIRSVYQMGTARFNRFTLGLAAQSYCSVLKEKNSSPSVVIGFDCRRGSFELSRHAASVFAACGVRVRLFRHMRPTPQLSFAVKYYCADGGLNITASHNSFEYGGCKFYAEGGIQIPDSAADIIRLKMEQSDIFSVPSCDFDEALKNGDIVYIDEDFDKIFQEEELKYSAKISCPDLSEVRVAYTPLHGVGGFAVPSVLQKAGVKNLFSEPLQSVPDGDFTYAKDPNPENEGCYSLVKSLAEEQKADIVLATDPDCDRIGVMALSKEGEYVFLSGNQTGYIMLTYIIQSLKAKNAMPENPFAVSTVVSGRLAEKIARKEGVRHIKTFTGFKNIARAVSDDAENCVFAFEEAFGYLPHTLCLDKDGVGAALLMVKIAAECKAEGRFVTDCLEEIYDKYGRSFEGAINIYIDGADWAEKSKKVMTSLRRAVPSSVAGQAVRYFTDFFSGVCLDLEKKYVESLDKKGVDVLSFKLSDGSEIYIRPSGTEPKIKAYILLEGKSDDSLKAQAERIEKDILSLVQQYSEV